MAIDKRVIKTRSSIKYAFMELALEKDISKISVSDIAERALINRSTFYLHYTDVRSVADDIEALFASTISECIEQFDLNDLYGSACSLFSRLTYNLDKDVTLKEYIIRSKNSQNVADKIKNIIVEKALDSIDESRKSKALYPLIFAASGIIDCYLKWTRSDGAIPLETVISQLSEITHFIVDKIK